MNKRLDRRLVVPAGELERRVWAKVAARSVQKGNTVRQGERTGDVIRIVSVPGGRKMLLATERYAFLLGHDEEIEVVLED